MTGITYERDGDGFVAVVPDGHEVTREFEVAAWYEKVVLEGGRYPMRAWSSFQVVGIPGRTIERHTPSLFGGVMTGGGDFQKQVDESTTYTLQIHTFMVNDAAAGHGSHLDDGRFCGCPAHIETAHGNALYVDRFERTCRCADFGAGPGQVHTRCMVDHDPEPEEDPYTEAMRERFGDEAVAGYEAHVAEMEREHDRMCGDVIHVGPAHDPYATICDLDRGHDGYQHEGLDPLGGPTDRIRWTRTGAVTVNVEQVR